MASKAAKSGKNNVVKAARKLIIFLKGQTMCKICREMFDDPRTLPECQHKVCFKCLEQIMEENEIKCPFCRKVNFVSNGGRNLPRSISTLDAVEQLKEQQSILDDEQSDDVESTDEEAPTLSFCTPANSEFFVDTIGGQKLTMKMPLSAKVERLKAEVEERTNMAPEHQKLIYLGKLMENGFSLEHYGLKRGHVVQLVTSFSGGIYTKRYYG